MPFKATVTFDTKGLQGYLDGRFGVGSDAQYEWSKIVFNGSEKYIPFLTGDFRNRSIAASEPLFAQGELLYPGPYAQYLWHGFAMEGTPRRVTDRPLQYTQKEGHGLAGAQWTDRAANDNLPAWEAEMQGLIDNGRV